MDETKIERTLTATYLNSLIPLSTYIIPLDACTHVLHDRVPGPAINEYAIVKSVPVRIIITLDWIKLMISRGYGLPQTTSGSVS